MKHKELTHQEQQVLIFVLREDAAKLQNKIDMFRERCNDLEESLARSGALLADTEAKLDGAMTEANDLRVRVEGLLLEIEELSNG